MKLREYDQHGLCKMSLPARGVWIEIGYRREVISVCGCRSPQGECGLKWDELGRQRLALVSLPARGVWIEILSIVFNDMARRILN